MMMVKLICFAGDLIFVCWLFQPRTEGLWETFSTGRRRWSGSAAAFQWWYWWTRLTWWTPPLSAGKSGGLTVVQCDKIMTWGRSRHAWRIWCTYKLKFKCTQYFKVPIPLFHKSYRDNPFVGELYLISDCCRPESWIYGGPLLLIKLAQA